MTTPRCSSQTPSVATPIAASAFLMTRACIVVGLSKGRSCRFRNRLVHLDYLLQKHCCAELDGSVASLHESVKSDQSSLALVLLQPLHRWAANYETAISEQGTVGTCDEAILGVSQNLKLFAKLLPIPFADRVRGPFIELSIPHWTVIRCVRGNPAEGVVRTKAVCKGGVEPFPLWIRAVH